MARKKKVLTTVNKCHNLVPESEEWAMMWEKVLQIMGADECLCPLCLLEELSLLDNKVGEGACSVITSYNNLCDAEEDFFQTLDGKLSGKGKESDKEEDNEGAGAIDSLDISDEEEDTTLKARSRKRKDDLNGGNQEPKKKKKKKNKTQVDMLAPNGEEYVISDAYDDMMEELTAEPDDLDTPVISEAYINEMTRRGNATEEYPADNTPF